MLYKAHDIVEKSYDVIVIGSGLAGMTLANKLGREGRRVLLLESHNKLGGFATWFKRNHGQYIFDVSLHGFPVGMIKTCRRYWNQDIASRIEQVKKVRFINPQFSIETDFTKTDYTNILVEKFGLERTKIDAFFNSLSSMNFFDSNHLTNGQLFESFFPGRNDVVRFLLEPIVYANGSNLNDEAITYGIVFSNFMSKGVYIFRGGTDLLISMMRDELLANGVDIKMQSKVDQILVHEQKVQGIVLQGQKISAKSVVSNANIYNTIFSLTGESYYSPCFIEKAKKVRLNTSSCQVFMGIKEGESIEDIGELIFYSDDEYFSSESLLSPLVGSQTFSVYYPETRPQGTPRYAIVSSSNARYEDWSQLTSEEYQEQKKYVQEKALSTLEKIVPGVRAKIDYVCTSTPLTVERYTHHKNGASFGTKFEGLEISKTLPQQIEGLFHAGSVGIIMSGWLGAANYGVIQAHEVEAYLYQNENQLAAGEEQNAKL